MTWDLDLTRPRPRPSCNKNAQLSRCPWVTFSFLSVTHLTSPANLSKPPSTPHHLTPSPYTPLVEKEPRTSSSTPRSPSHHHHPLPHKPRHVTPLALSKVPACVSELCTACLAVTREFRHRWASIAPLSLPSFFSSFSVSALLFASPSCLAVVHRAGPRSGREIDKQNFRRRFLLVSPTPRQSKGHQPASNSFNTTP